MFDNSSSTVFRAQLIVPEQRQLFDYWLTRCKGRSMPTRRDLNPAHIPRLLSGISLIEVGDSFSAYKVRLAGTRLREIFDREITGLTFSELDLADKYDYWSAAYRHTIENGKPTQGILRGPHTHKEHLIQYWLKLPLASDDGTVTMILCYDYFISATDEATLQLSFAAGL